MELRYKLISVLAAVLIFACFSYWYSGYPGMGDFVVFYSASHVIIDPNVPATEVYNPNVLKSALPGISTENLTLAYKYSIFAAYLMAPLAFLSFREAEAVLIFLNIFCYAVSIFLILKSCGARNRWFFYPFVASFLWMPFIKNIQYGQINAILFFCMTLAIVLARNNRYLLSGFLLAIATLFKPFFLAVTMVLCIKNWRIVFGYLPVIILALMLPGTGLWFKSFLWPPHPFFCYSALYNYLGHFNQYYFVTCALAIGLITALITYINRQQDFLPIASFAIAGAFLAMPVLEANHLTILIFFMPVLFSRSPAWEKKSQLVSLSY